MTSHLEKEISALKEMLLAMAGRAEHTVSEAMRAFAERNDDLARSVISQDALVDRLEVEIDELVILLLSKAMLATDLRLMTVAMKLSNHLERVADEATTIARRTILLNAEPPAGPPLDLPHLAGLAVGMLHEAVAAFTSHQPQLARAIIGQDREVDALNKKFHEALISHMLQDRGSIHACLNLMVISKCLEHVADQAVSVAEAVVYLYEAQDVRHANQLSARTANLLAGR